MQFAMMLKTYGPDAAYAARLIRSFNRHNLDHVTLFVVLPQSDFEAFARETGNLPPNIQLVQEDNFAAHLVTGPVHGIRPGYINQEIIKLAFWETGLADNYLCLDSDGEFIRDFRVTDFMFDETTPYTILVEDNELAADPVYHQEHWEGRKVLIRKIQEAVGVDARTMLTSHGFSMLSATVLRSFKDNFLRPRGWSYADALELSPYEFSWYNMWLQKDRTIPIYHREPLFKVFHHKGQHIDHLQRGVSIEDLARGYIGIVINSNYSRGYGMVSYNDRNVYTPTLGEIGRQARSALLGAVKFAQRLPSRALRRITRHRY